MATPLHIARKTTASEEQWNENVREAIDNANVTERRVSYA